MRSNANRRSAERRRIWTDPRPRTGFLALRRGAHDADGTTRGRTMYNWRQIPSRLGRDAGWLFLCLLDSWYERKPGAEWYAVLNAGVETDTLNFEHTRRIGQLLAILVHKGVVAPVEGERRHYRLYPERIAALPRLCRAPKKLCGRAEASVSAPPEMAQLARAAGESDADAAARDALLRCGEVVSPVEAIPFDNDDCHRLSEAAGEAPAEVHGCAVSAADSPAVNQVAESETSFRFGLGLGAAAAFGLLEIGNQFPISAAESEAGYAPGESGFAWNSGLRSGFKRLERPKNVVGIDEASIERACSPIAGDTINEWLARQPWGRVDSTTRRGLSDADLKPFLSKLAQSGRTAEQFVSWQRANGVTIGAERSNIVGLLISLIPPPVREPYSARNAPDQRSTDLPGDRSK